MTVYDYILKGINLPLPWTCPLKQSVYNLQRRKKELKKLIQKYNVPCWVSVNEEKQTAFKSSQMSVKQ